ncbi:hypothetical protein [Streptomyces sp. NPDC049970]|uniref:hypothetical protein n=1 Tax=Streptomyces sp. NPDC049970 TaxID=3155033 RepID=UPI0034435A95
MNLVRTPLRWAIASAAAGVLVLTGASASGASVTPEPSARQAGSTAPAASGTAAESGSTGPLSSYRGIQGGNLCLLARCTVGNSGPGGHTGPSNTQGFNLCLLSACTVRP